MRRMFFGMLMVVAGVLLSSGPLTAHHGAANFDTGKVLKLEGTVTEWLWGNPHCFLKFEAKDFTGTVRTWVAETQNPVGMTSRGWSRRSFKAGDKVIVEVEPVKDGQPVGKVLTVVLPSGQKLYALGDGTAEGNNK